MKKGSSLSEKLVWVAIAIMLFQNQVFPSEGTTESLLLLLILGGIYMLLNGKFSINMYLLLASFLLLINAVRFLGGRNEDAVFSRLVLYTAKLGTQTVIFIFLLSKDHIQKYVRMYMTIAIISLAALYLIIGADVISTRLGHNGSGSIVSFYLFGKPIYKSSNGTANFCAIGMFFSLYYAVKQKRKIMYLFALFLLTGVLLSGSRKGIMVALLYLYYSLFVMDHGNNIKKFLLAVILPITFLGIIFYIPAVYDIIGIRIHSLVLNLLGETNVLDNNSYLLRKQLSNMAIVWIKEKPFLGWGEYQFVSANNGLGPESNYLAILLNNGFLGLICYYGYVFSVGKSVLMGYKQMSQLQKMLLLIVCTKLITDIGSVSYIWMNEVLWISIFFASIGKYTVRISWNRITKSNMPLRNCQLESNLLLPDCD